MLDLVGARGWFRRVRGRPVVQWSPFSILAWPWAQAFKGKSTASGTGMSGWAMNMVPGWRLLLFEAEAVFGSLGLGRVEPPGDPDGAVGQDPALDLRRGLLRPDEDDAEGPAALGDVEQDLLDGALALARRVTASSFTNISGRAVPWRSLRGNSPWSDADDHVGQVVQVDDGAGRGRWKLTARRGAPGSPRMIALSGLTADRTAQQGIDAAGDRAPGDPSCRAASRQPTSASSSSTRSPNVFCRVVGRAGAAVRTAPWLPAWTASRRSRAATCPIRVACSRARSSSASANANGGGSYKQNSASVPSDGLTALSRADTSGVPAVSPGRGGAKTLTFWNGVAGSPSSSYRLRCSGSDADWRSRGAAGPRP